MFCCERNCFVLCGDEVDGLACKRCNSYGQCRCRCTTYMSSAVVNSLSDHMPNSPPTPPSKPNNMYLSSLVKREFQLINGVFFECWIFCFIDEHGRESFWFKGKDIATFLGYENSRKAILDNIEPKWKKSWKELKDITAGYNIETPSNWQETSIFISEPGLYALITRSKLPEAKKFMDWLVNMLPTLRQDCFAQFRSNNQDVENEQNIVKPLSERLNTCTNLPPPFGQKSSNTSLSVLVKREFQLGNNVSFECWIFRFVDEHGRESFWFKGKDIATFLGYGNARHAIADNVKPKWKKSWNDLFKGGGATAPLETPSNWQPSSIFISEPGLYALITRSKLPEAEKFTDWVYEEVLPMLRQEGHYNMKNSQIEQLANGLLLSNQALIKANSELIQARQDAVALSHRLADIAQDVVSKPESQQLLHALAVHELNPTEIAFTRCQRRSLANAMKRVISKNPKARELYRNGYVPNSVNVLNCFKDVLRRKGIAYSARNNIVKLALENMNSEEIVSLIESTIRS